MTRHHHLAELQLAIMQILWDRGGATVAEVRQALQPERDLAHTTVGTMLAKLEEGGRATHRSDGRVNIYRPLIEREQVARSMVSDLAERLFGGDVTEMFCHLLDGTGWLRGQRDNPPRQGTYPTVAWSPGETVVDVYRVPLASDAPLGEALIEVGMYDPLDGQRLPVLGRDADPEQRRVLLRNLIQVQRMEP